MEYWLLSFLPFWAVWLPLFLMFLFPLASFRIPLTKLMAVETLDVNKTRIPINVSGVIRQLFLRITGNIVVTAAITLVDEVPQKILSSIKYEFGERSQKWDGRGLYGYNFMMSGGKNPYNSPPATGVATNPFTAWLALPFAHPRSRAEHLTLFDNNRKRNPELEITWAAAADFISAGTTTGFTALACKVLADVYIGNPRQIPGYPFADLIVGMDRVTSTGVDSELKLKIPMKRSLRGVLLRVSDLADAGVSLDDTKLNSLQLLFNDIPLIPKLTYDELQEINLMGLGFAEQLNTPRTGYDVEGYLWIDFIRMGLHEMVPAGDKDAKSFEFLFDVDANTQIDAYFIQVGK